MEKPDSLEHKQAILEYWTLIEFFSPYILDNVLDHRQCYQKIYADKHSNAPLPWLSAQTIREDDSATPFAKGYNLYLGLFSLEETADRARHTFAKQPSQWQSVNWQGCAATDSITCFARLTITTHGIPLFGTLSLSTLPWAHGRLLDGQEDALTLENYWKSVNRLLLCMREELSTQLPMKFVKEPKIQAKYLDEKALSNLIESLYAWAGYQPDGYPLALIESVSGDRTVVPKEPPIKTERDVPILNSFYIQDLESAAISLNTQKGKPIDRYLSGAREKRVALGSEEGAKAILNAVRPENTTSARWPDRLTLQQSLMQQFAINATFNQDVFSVNGPPGTGKTSLLREIIAQNIVARAKILSQFTMAKDAFVGRQALNFENSDPIFVSELHPSLLGYEMLVVSSNNTAVQNLSQELPLRSQLDPAYHYASYLETVAAKALGLPEKEAWGLISVTLGNMENCRQCVESVFITRSEVNGKTRIWEWIDAYNGPSFREAKEAFIAIKNRQEQLSNELELLAFLHDEIHGHTVETYCAKALKSLKSAEEESVKILKISSHFLKEERRIRKNTYALLQERETLWKQDRPNTLPECLNRKAYKSGRKSTVLSAKSVCEDRRAAQI